MAMVDLPLPEPPAIQYLRGGRKQKSNGETVAAIQNPGISENARVFAYKHCASETSVREINPNMNR